MASDGTNFTRKKILAAFEKGRWLVIFDRKVYDVTDWAPKHPGGELLIRHVIGRDATDQILVNHSEDVIKRLNAFYVDKMAPDDMTINQPLSMAFRELHREFISKGYFNTDVSFYAFQYARLFTFFVISLLILFNWGHVLTGCLAAAFFMGNFWHQLAFLEHDTGHNSITHSRKIDNFVGIVAANFMAGVSNSWWKGSHNVHHLVTNDPEHDPDIQHLPFFAQSTRFFDSLFSTFHRRRMHFDLSSRLLVSLQHLTYLPVMMVARFNLYILSFMYLFKNETYLKPLEVIGLISYWCWFPWLISVTIPSTDLRLVFFFASLFSSFLIHVQINISHYAMPSESINEDEEFVRHQMRTTLDVECPEWLDWFHGGLQFQAVHHLFPRMPRHNLRRARDRMVEFCKEHNLPYHCKTFPQANWFVLKHLKSIADQVQILAYFIAAEKQCSL